MRRRDLGPPLVGHFATHFFTPRGSKRLPGAQEPTRQPEEEAKQTTADAQRRVDSETKQKELDGLKELVAATTDKLATLVLAQERLERQVVTL